MTRGQKLLIDTNVIIGLEDWKELPPSFASLQRLSSQFGHRIFVHEAEVDDIERDRDIARRRVTLSKFAKFERLVGVKTPPISQLAMSYGAIASENDQVDAALLYALQLGAVDFLVTEDQGIHARARRVSGELADRVLTVNDAVSWLALQHEPREVRLPLVGEVPAHAIDPADSIFDGLRNDYVGFDNWWREKCVGEHRPCWTVTIGGELAGLVVRKDESADGRRVLKLCTFKVKPEFRGEKLGELLLKQAIWFAQRNRYDSIYLTTYPEQAALIAFLTYFGFEQNGTRGGELILSKALSSKALGSHEDVTGAVHVHYPRFAVSSQTGVFCVPIRGDYHDMLFPELADRTQLSLFEGMGLPTGPRTPGNTIRKVYLSRANSRGVSPGSVLLFYRSNTGTPSTLSQHITTIGVAEQVSTPPDFETLVRMTAKRSVYSAEQQAALMEEDSRRPLRVFDFLLMGHLSPPMSLGELLAEGVFIGHPPQSISQLPLHRARPVLERADLGFEI